MTLENDVMLGASTSPCAAWTKLGSDGDWEDEKRCDRREKQHDQNMRGKCLQGQVKTPFLADSSNQRQEPDVRATFADQ